MRIRRIFLVLFILTLVISSCVQKLTIGDANAGEDKNMTSGESYLSTSNLPNNLNIKYGDDLADLTDAPVYTLDITIDEDKDLIRVAGTQEVLYTNNETVPLNEIYFKLIPNVGGDYLAVSDVTIDSAAVEPVLEYSNTVMRLDFDEPLDPGETLTISMVIDAVVPSEMGGNYGLYVYTDDILALDAFFPLIPVYDEEGWNVEQPAQNADMVFSDAAFFSVTVDTPKSYVIAAGGHEVGRKVKIGRQVVTYEAGPQRDFYLAASPNFVKESTWVDGVEVTSYFLKEHREAGKNVLEVAAHALDIFGNRFGAYPYTELDLVSTPMRAGGMEYSSITALGLAYYDPDESFHGIPSAVILESATAHEVGHMWFYAQVMSDQIDEPWLDESLVQYVTYLYYLDRYGKSAGLGFRESLLQRWARVAMEPVPINLKAQDYRDAEYGAIIYGRGALFFEELETEIGEAKFTQLMRDYANEFRWGIARTDDFLNMAQDACGCDLSWLFADYGFDG